MTIDLGFADLASTEVSIGIIDVPGHERFLKNMLAGATGVDAALLVIDAEEGAMPQTREHMAILQLLGVETAVIALTKIDKVDREWLELALDQARELIAGGPWEKAEIVPVSAIAGAGLEDVRAAIFRAAAAAAPKPIDAPFRMTIDRVFPRPGFGTIVTGTALSGVVRLNQRLLILPRGEEARIRGIQSHGKNLEQGVAGQRLAINLAGADKAVIERGCLLAQEGAARATARFNAKVRLLDKPVAHGESPDKLALTHQMRVRVHAGAAEALGRVYLLDEGNLGTGEEGYVQIRLESPLALAQGDRFIVRRYSPLTTLGGGIALDLQPGKYRRRDPETLKRLRGETQLNRLAAILSAMPSGAARKEIQKSHPELTGEEIASALAEGTAIELSDGRLISGAMVERLAGQAFQSIAQYHSKHPLKSGMPIETLRSALKADRATLEAALKGMAGEGKIELLSVGRERRVRLSGFEIAPNAKQQALLTRVMAALDSGGAQPPPLGEVGQQVGAPPQAIQEMVSLGLELGQIAMIDEGLYYTASRLKEIMDRTAEFIRTHGSITAAQLRDELGASRKYAVPLLEHFDSIGFTLRQGDARTLPG